MIHKRNTVYTVKHNLPIKPKISLIVGTKMTRRLLKNKMAAAMRICRIQLNSRPANSSVVMEERI